jgi:peptide chain release factor 2
MELKIKDLEMLSLEKDFWEDQDKARGILQKKTKFTENLNNWKKFNNQISDIEHLWTIAQEEKDDQVMSDLSNELDRLSLIVRQDELKMMLASEQDPMNAIVSIHAGAGGTEAQDWAEML